MMDVGGNEVEMEEGIFADEAKDDDGRVAE